MTYPNLTAVFSLKFLSCLLRKCTFEALLEDSNKVSFKHLLTKHDITNEFSSRIKNMKMKMVKETNNYVYVSTLSQLFCQVFLYTNHS